MKAFMSERHTTNWHRGECQIPVNAVIEAERILAETEAMEGSDTWFQGTKNEMAAVRTAHRDFAHMRRGFTAGLLAEALAAFVERS